MKKLDVALKINRFIKTGRPLLASSKSGGAGADFLRGEVKAATNTSIATGEMFVNVFAYFAPEGGPRFDHQKVEYVHLPRIRISEKERAGADSFEKAFLLYSLYSLRGVPGALLRTQAVLKMGAWFWQGAVKAKVKVGEIGVKGLKRFGVFGRGGWGEKAIAREERMVYHSVTSTKYAQGVLERVDTQFFNERSRFGGAFYLSEDALITLAELEEHNAVATQTIRYMLDTKSARVLDLTNPRVAKMWEYERGATSDITKSITKSIGKRAKDEGYNVIRYPSERGPGVNYAMLDKFEVLLSPQMIVPVPSPKFYLKMLIEEYSFSPTMKGH